MKKHYSFIEAIYPPKNSAFSDCQCGDSDTMSTGLINYNDHAGCITVYHDESKIGELMARIVAGINDEV